jgi:ABC-type transport system involved in multi-copper enzyme maturation permease subunit
MSRKTMDLIKRTIRDAWIVLAKELLVYRRLFIYLLPTFVMPAMVIVFQVGLILFLAKSGNNGLVLAASIINTFKMSMLTSFGLVVILGAAGPLATGMISRERYSGALEGFLSTPISTTSLWIGKSIASWLPGAIIYILSLVATIVIVNTFLGEVGAYTLAEYRSAAGMSVLLLIVTMLMTAFLVQLQLGSSQRISVVLMFGQIGLAMVLLPLLGYRLLKGESLGSEQLLIVEIVCIPVMVLFFVLTKRVLLNRENIVMRFTR